MCVRKYYSAVVADMDNCPENEEEMEDINDVRDSVFDQRILAIPQHRLVHDLPS
jgi:hypothetical protein